MTARGPFWIPKYRYRRFDFGPELRNGRKPISPIRFGSYLTRSGLKRIAEHYGFNFEKLEQSSPSAWKLIVPPAVSDEKLRRFANYIDRTPKLGGLSRVSMDIRRQFAMPDRLRHKRL